MRFVRQSGLCWGDKGGCVREQSKTFVAEAQLKELGMCGWESGLRSVLLRLMADSLAGDGLDFFLWPQRAKPGLRVGHVQVQHQGEPCSNLCWMAVGQAASPDLTSPSLRCSGRGQKAPAGNMV